MEDQKKVCSFIENKKNGKRDNVCCVYSRILIFEFKTVFFSNSLILESIRLELEY